jgi:hypothetical protein
MATKIYETKRVKLIDGTSVEVSPLKIKYLRDFLNMFEFVKTATNDDEAITFLSYCALIAMQQYYPKIATIHDIEDHMDLPTVYKVLDIAAGIKINKEKKDESVKDQAVESGSAWEELDLAKLESEAFLLGIWKDYEELETSLSMPELTATLSAKRDNDYQDKKFFAAIQGVDLDKQSGNNDQNAWEKMKAKVFSGGATDNSNDILAYQGANAQKAGFGIGMGISYERID